MGDLGQSPPFLEPREAAVPPCRRLLSSTPVLLAPPPLPSSAPHLPRAPPPLCAAGRRGDAELPSSVPHLPRAPRPLCAAGRRSDAEQGADPRELTVRVATQRKSDLAHVSSSPLATAGSSPLPRFSWSSLSAGGGRSQGGATKVVAGRRAAPGGDAWGGGGRGLGLSFLLVETFSKGASTGSGQPTSTVAHGNGGATEQMYVMYV